MFKLDIHIVVKIIYDLIWTVVISIVIKHTIVGKPKYEYIFIIVD